MLTEDARVPSRGDCQFEAGMSAFALPGPDYLEPGESLTCGIGWNSYLYLDAWHAEHDVRVAGLTLSGKSLLWQNSDDAAAGLVWAAWWERDAGHWQHSGATLSAIYSQPLNERFTAHFNLGEAYDRASDASAVTWAFALEHAGPNTERLSFTPLIELLGGNHEAPWWNAVLYITTLSERLWIGLSYGQQLDSAHAQRTSASVTVSF